MLRLLCASEQVGWAFHEGENFSLFGSPPCFLYTQRYRHIVYFLHHSLQRFGNSEISISGIFLVSLRAIPSLPEAFTFFCTPQLLKLPALPWAWPAVICPSGLVQHPVSAWWQEGDWAFSLRYEPLEEGEGLISLSPACTALDKVFSRWLLSTQWMHMCTKKF